MIGEWYFEIKTTRNDEFKWGLHNRRGDLVMLSPDTFATRDQAEASAEFEARFLNDVEVRT